MAEKKKGAPELTEAQKEKARAQLQRQKEKAAKKSERQEAKAAKDQERYEKRVAAERKQLLVGGFLLDVARVELYPQFIGEVHRHRAG